MMKIIMINYSGNDDDVDDAVSYFHVITNYLSSRMILIAGGRVW